MVRDGTQSALGILGKCSTTEPHPLALKMEFLMLKILYLKEALIISGFMKQSKTQTWKVQEYICGFFLVILAHCYVSLNV